MTIRSVPLGEARANAADLDRRIRGHRHYCTDCRPRQIAHWFDPGPDQGAIF